MTSADSAGHTQSSWRAYLPSTRGLRGVLALALGVCPLGVCPFPLPPLPPNSVSGASSNWAWFTMADAMGWSLPTSMAAASASASSCRT